MFSYQQLFVTLKNARCFSTLNSRVVSCDEMSSCMTPVSYVVKFITLPHTYCTCGNSGLDAKRITIWRLPGINRPIVGGGFKDELNLG